MPTGVYKRKPGLSKEEINRRSCERMKRYASKEPKKIRDSRLMRRYGMPPGHYDKLSAMNNDCCIICDQKCPAGRGLAVDHDHKNGVVRGLLCVNCNRGLGNFKDNISLLREAAQYLEFYASGGR